jgi:hypothetical protein
LDSLQIVKHFHLNYKQSKYDKSLIKTKNASANREKLMKLPKNANTPKHIIDKYKQYFNIYKDVRERNEKARRNHVQRLNPKTPPKVSGQTRAHALGLLNKKGITPTLRNPIKGGKRYAKTIKKK